MTRMTRPSVIDEAGGLLTPREVAAAFRVDPKTVTRWAAAGRIGSIRTLGGHRRYRESEVKALLGADGAQHQPTVDENLLRRALEAGDPR